MKDKLLFALAFITHPILIPFYFYLFSGFSDAEELTYLALITVILPVIIFRLRKIDLAQPSMKDRKLIYATLGIIYLTLVLVEVVQGAVFDTQVKVFLPFALGMLALFIGTWIMKLSWHAMGWGLAMFLSIGLSYSNYHSMEHKEVSFLATYVVAGIGIGVMLVRYLQNAHSIHELITGYMIGLIIPILILFAV